MSRYMRNFLFAFFLLWVVIAFLSMLAVKRAQAHDHEHPELDAWYKSLMMPDNPTVPCCGEADAYWCDDYYARDGKAYCKITDDRDDAPLKRPHVDIGTEFEIPPEKLKWEQSGKPTGNPTGSAIIFLSSTGHVYCYVQSTGI